MAKYMATTIECAKCEMQPKNLVSFKMSKPHSCAQKMCMCAEVNELTHLYRELKCQRKLAVKRNKSNAHFEFSTMELDKSACNLGLESLLQQRECVKELVHDLDKMSKALAEYEEDICQTDKEIADLQNQLDEIKKSVGGENCHPRVKLEKSDACWRESVLLEIRERNVLQEKINQMVECIECIKAKRIANEAKFQEDKRTDAKLLLDAIKLVGMCTKNSSALVCAKGKRR